LGGTTGVECRTGGAAGNHQIVVTFATPVTFTGASVTSGTGNVSGSSVSGSEVTGDLTAVANAEQIAGTLSGVSDGVNTNDVIIAMRLVLGDTTANGTVNAADVSQTKAQVGQAATNSNFRTDVNVTGSIGASDVSVVKSQAGTFILTE